MIQLNAHQLSQLEQVWPIIQKLSRSRPYSRRRAFELLADRHRRHQMWTASEVIRNLLREAKVELQVTDATARPAQ